MNYVILNNGVKMPQVGLGTYLLSPDDAQPSVAYALDNGYELIKVAQILGQPFLILTKTPAVWRASA